MNNDYTILAIDTSCDETAAAVTVDDRVMSNVISSQVELHKKWGGVVPILAQRAHRERIDAVIGEALKRVGKYQKSRPKADPSLAETIKNQKEKTKFKTAQVIQSIDAIAVTIGPGLAPALEVGIAKAKELARQYKKPLIAVNHMEGHLLSPFAKNVEGHGSIIADSYSQARQGRAATNLNATTRVATTNTFSLLALLVSGNHTELVLADSIGRYTLLGETLDDACGEAFDKVGRMLEVGYPGGPIIERLAKTGDPYAFDLPVPMRKRKDLNFSYSGIKTALLYLTRDLKRQGKFDKKTICNLAASFQRVVSNSLTDRLVMAVKQYKPKGILLGGGVISNLTIRQAIRQSMRKYRLPVYIPYSRNLFTDNAAMIGVAAYFKAKRGEFVKDIAALDRNPNLSFELSEQKSQ